MLFARISLLFSKDFSALILSLKVTGLLKLQADGHYDPTTGEWVPSEKVSMAKKRWNWAFKQVVQVRLECLYPLCITLVFV